MEVFGTSPPTEKVDPSAPELSGARSRQEKPYAPGFDEPVNLIQKFREPLNLVNDYNTVMRSEFLCNASWILTERKIHRCIKKIIRTSFFQ
jgi:hypothetical protein